MNTDEFSKNSIITISRKAGVKCISQCGIEKVKTLLTEKLQLLSEKLALYHEVCNGKTISKKNVIEFLQSEDVFITHNT